MRRPRPLPALATLIAVGLGLAGVAAVPAAGPPPPVTGARDPAWAPDGARIALSIREQIWVLSPDGRTARTVSRWPRRAEALERDPAWSPDGRTLAFSARAAAGGFDLYVVDATGGTPRRVTDLEGDERWPSWTPDGRLVFAAHGDGQWDLRMTAPIPGPAAGRTAQPTPTEALTATAADETEPRVSPDGRLVVFVSNEAAPDGETDLWVLQLSGRVAATAGGLTRPAPARLHREPGSEQSPAWSPDGTRLAYAAMLDGVGSLRIIEPELPAAPGITSDTARGATPPVVVSRHAGAAAWSPDGRTLLATDVRHRDDGYNGQPARARRAALPPFPSAADAGARFLAAPAPPDAAARPLRAHTPATAARRLSIFDALWSDLARRYFADAPAAVAWQTLRDRYRPQAAAADGDLALEAAFDAMIAEQPLVRVPVRSAAGLVVAAHPLAADAGAAVLRAGGNAVDAAIAVSFTLGVVEPDASGIGGDGIALIWRAGADAPVVVDFKDQAPGAASLGHPALVRDGRLVEHGPAAINVPGVVAGMDHLHRRYGSGRLTWADLVAPAIAHAADGVVLDDTLPATVAEARATIARYPAARQLLLPAGRPLRPGDRFRNPDYAATLRVIAREGADAFYRGGLARRMVDDLARHGGLLSLDDLEQYRVVERAAVRGRYRGHVVFSTPPPVASGTALIEVLQTFAHAEVRPGTRVTSDADAAHALLESFRLGHPIRAADPALWPDASAIHLDAAHAAAIWSRVDPQRAGRRRIDSDDDAPPAGSSGPGAARAGEGDGGPGSRLGSGTSAFVTIDRDGTLVVVTQTLSTWGGSFYVSEGLGFLYNNHLRMARTRRGVPGQLTPRARSSSANASTIVCREVDGRLVPRLALGAAGSAWIVPSVAGVVSAVVDGGLDAQAAVEAPRLRVDDGGEVQIEDRLPGAVVADLVGRGHAVTRIGAKGELRFGFVSAIAIDAAGTRSAGADPRRSHAAVAVP